MIFSIVPAYIASWVPGSRPEPSTQSVELDRIDAHGRSNAPNLSDRIKKDIENGVYVLHYFILCRPEYRDFSIPIVP